MREHTLADGTAVYYASKMNLDIVWRQIFEDRLYTKNGITINDGDCVFDVGANIGVFVLFLSKHAKNARVVAFEPVPDTFEILSSNVKRHGHSRIELVNCGLSAAPGEATFTHFPRNNVASTMFPDDSVEYRRNSRSYALEEMRKKVKILRPLIRITPAGAWWPVTEMLRRIYQKKQLVTCQLSTISKIISEKSIERIDLLKIDAEGAECDIFAGIHSEHWPLIHQIIVEVHDETGREKVVKNLKEHGFKCCAEQLVPNVPHLHMVYATRP